MNTASPATKDLHHHDVARDKKPVEGTGKFAPCTAGFKGAPVDPFSLRASPLLDLLAWLVT